jgi:GT2 family glycosyltransferase
MRRHRHRNKRNPNLEKIQQALAKKVIAPNNGLTSEQISKLSKDPKRKEIARRHNFKRNVYNSKQKFKRGHKSLGKKHPYQSPGTTTYPAPDWFKIKPEQKDDIEVSIIVPMYKSKEAIKRQILSWENVNRKCEIIYVSDACPQKSHIEVVQSWVRRKNKKNNIGQIILHTQNAGFATACNTGANYANGKYLIFLNADCTVTPNWVEPMIELLESDPEIGMVGNLQLGNNGLIDSCGSQWSWKEKSFRHLGKHIHRGESIQEMKLNDAPEDIMSAGERDMVTGCCFAIEKKLFIDLHGFDINYRVGYWEDSDLNMRVKDRGYKVCFTPKSKIHHSVGHSKSGGHPFIPENRKFFYDRWLETGRIDKHISFPRPPKDRPGGGLLKNNVDGKVVGCVIACNEEEFLEASVDSVAPIVDEWIIVVGGNQYAHKAGMCDELGNPTDNTLEIAHELVKKYGGKVIPPPGRLWFDKIEMRNSYASHLNAGNWMFMVDGDEVYREEQLWRTTELMRHYHVLIMQFWLFWNNVNTLGTGSWQLYPQERIVKWGTGYHYKKGQHLHVANRGGRLVKTTMPTWQGSEKLFYHYSWVRPIEKIMQKQLYYKYQSGIDQTGYIDDVFLKWREDPEAVRGKTHPKQGGDWTEFPGIHPPQVQKLIDEGKLNF